MPTKACCCDPKGRHVAVACRYYGWHTATYVKDAVGNSAGDPRFVGPDGFTIKDFGYQRLFGLTLTPLFSTEIETLIRGPYKWNVTIKEFDSTRDVVLLSRSGGGSSQYTKDETGVPKGGNSSLLQTRVKASLAMEANVGAGGTLFGGGKGTGIGSLLSPTYNPNSVPGGGAGGGVDGAGGHGGITNGGEGFGTGNGRGGSQTAGGCAGGSGAFDGLEYEGGTGAAESGGGGGGRYSGGGGANKAGGGGAASKWPAGVSGFSDLAYSEEGSNKGPGGICDPFVPLQETLYHYGMAGGSNLVQDPPTGVGPASPTNFLGFGTDFNPSKEGTPGVVRAVWIDKYCPCAGSCGSQEQDGSAFKTDLPDKMYICLTDAQYAVIENEMDVADSVFNLVKFDLDGETYIYFGRCVNAYCKDVRLVDGTPSNIRQTDITNIQADQGGQGVLLNDCCDALIAYPICKVQEANCYDCNNCYNCLPALKLKYCCDNIEDKPDSYWSIYQGYLWRTEKFKFWFPFGKKPEDSPLDISDVVISPLLPIIEINAPLGFEKLCLVVGGTGPSPLNVCDGNDNDCDPYVPDPVFGFGEGHPCTVEIGTFWEGLHPDYLDLPITISGQFCGKPEKVSILSGPGDGSCEPCFETDQQCLCGEGCLESSELTVRYNSFCSINPVVVSGNPGTCNTPSGKNSFYKEPTEKIDITQYMNPILGLTITVPKCPGTNNPVTGVFDFNGMCGLRSIFKPEYGISLGAIAAALNSNPFGVVYQANEPNIFTTSRYGAQVCPEFASSFIIPPDPDLFAFVEEIETPTSFIKKYWYKPKTYIYRLQFGGIPVCFGSNTQVCNGVPCECTSPYIASNREGPSLLTCMWGIYNLVKMNAPIFQKGTISSDPDFPVLNLCSMPESLIAQLNANIPEGFFDRFGQAPPLGDSIGYATCQEYPDACFITTPTNPSFISCTEKITVSIG
jgi:hypothetical protein